MNTERLVGSGNQQVYLSDIMIQADTTLGATNLMLPKISTIKQYKDRTGYNSQPVMFSFYKILGSNDLVIVAGDGDTINGSASVTLTGALVNGFVTLTSDNTWAITISNGSSVLPNPFPPVSPNIPMGQSANYVILTPAALTITAPSQIVSGDVGQLGQPTPDALIFNAGADYPAPASNQAVADAATLYTLLTTKAATYTFGAGAVVLDTVNVGYGVGIFKAGVYKGQAGAAASTSVSGIVTLDGDGDYIFVFDGAITTGANTIFKLINGAKSSRIFFASSGALTTGAYTIWKGTSVSPAGQVTGANTNIDGRLLSTVAGISTGAVNSIHLPTS